MSLFKEKPKGSNGRKVLAAPPAESKFSKEYPTLFEYLSVEVYDDGEPRVPTTIILFVEDGQCKACVNDKENTRSAFLASKTMEGLFAAIEKGLLQESLAWRFSGPQKRK